MADVGILRPGLADPKGRPEKVSSLPLVLPRKEDVAVCIEIMF
jgi:hypothetical protein